MLLRACGKDLTAAYGQINIFRRHDAFFGQAVSEYGDILPVERVEQAVIDTAESHPQFREGCTRRVRGPFWSGKGVSIICVLV